MRREEDFGSLKEEYKNISIPEALEPMVKDTILLTKKRRKNYTRTWVRAVASTAAAFVLVVNISPTFAETLGDIPVIGNIIQVVNLREYKVQGERHEANITVPKVEGLANKELENQLNEKLEQEADQVYQEFLEMAKEWEDVDSAAHYSVDMGYEVLTDTSDVFSLKVDKTEIIASANQQVKFYNIDKKKEKAITLPGLFKDDTYVKLISEYVIGEMKKIMAADEKKVYWVGQDDFAEFKEITADQKFYINKDSKLVIFFEKYEVAPGSTGSSEFVIPTEVVQNILVDNAIIK